MKKLFRKDDKGVSPVIAVILMVAITVVLAGVLYVWVSQFSTD
jgi:flagellin-like protein